MESIKIDRKERSKKPKIKILIVKTKNRFRKRFEKLFEKGAK